jgi:hypothetical protein
MFFQPLTHQVFLVMLRLTNQVVRKENLEKQQNALEQNARRRRVGGSSGKTMSSCK